MLAEIRHDMPIAKVHPDGVTYGAEVNHPVKWFDFYYSQKQSRKEVKKLKEIYRKSLEKERE